MLVTRGKYVAISSFHFSHPEWLFSFSGGWGGGLHLNNCPFLSLPSWKTVLPWWPCGLFRNHSRGCGGGSARRRSCQRTGLRWSHTAARLDLQDSQQSTIRTTRNPSSTHNYIHWCVVSTTQQGVYTKLSTTLQQRVIHIWLLARFACEQQQEIPWETSVAYMANAGV